MKNEVNNNKAGTGLPQGPSVSYEQRKCTASGAVRSEKGIALVMVLVLAAMSLAIMAALVYMLTASTQISGIQKRYRTAADAGKGGTEVAYKFIAARGDPGITGINFAFSAPFLGTGLDCNGNTTDCLTAKLNLPTSCWPGACNSSLTIDPAVAASYDFSIDLGTAQTYRAYAKIVDTIEGNSGAEFGLIKSGVVAANSGEVSAMSMPYLYTMEVEAENTANTGERAKLSVLYQY